ncbi:hypothetical protein [Chryseobacterium gregarium]|uniref:hypothetical protein n=1 Tax=Chryseobacterium gregarium TaxID=456299 RepID=UPI000423531F|nr:hypothetical protein [Chryseobacterium gregarium]
MIRLFLFLMYSFTYSQSISGTYIPTEPKCKINLKIDPGNHFIFEIGKGKKIEGVVKLFKEDKTTYLDFNSNISAMFDNDTIYIQNSGNSINPYVRFEKCNEMYIHLAKKSDVETYLRH